jgi:hypothetical protein
MSEQTNEMSSLEVNYVCNILGSRLHIVFGPRGGPKKARVTRNLAFLCEYYVISRFHTFL